MSIVASILAASVMLAIAVALPTQAVLCSAFHITLASRRTKTFFVLNSISYLFKVVLPFFLLLCSFVLLLLILSASYLDEMEWDRKVMIVAVVDIALLVAFSQWLVVGLRSARLSYELDFQAGKSWKVWSWIMLLTWVLAFVCLHLSALPFFGGNSHFMEHAFGVVCDRDNCVYASNNEDCLACRLRNACSKCGARMEYGKEQYGYRSWYCPKCYERLSKCPACGCEIVEVLDWFHDPECHLVCPKCNAIKCVLHDTDNPLDCDTQKCALRPDVQPAAPVEASGQIEKKKQTEHLGSRVPVVGFHHASNPRSPVRHCP